MWRIRAETERARLYLKKTGPKENASRGEFEQADAWASFVDARQALCTARELHPYVANEYALAWRA